MGYARLFAPSETDFSSQGEGVLTDAVRCEVTEEVNGVFELELEYPVNGVHYDEISLRSLIVSRVDSDPNKDPQAFRVYKKSEPLNGIVTFYARHISYDLSGYPVQPFATFDGGVAEALTELVTHTNVVTETQLPFTFSVDENVPGNFAVDAPSSVRSWLGGRDGSILDVYGGEWVFNNFTCRLVRHRGSDSGVAVRYGMNLKSVDWVTDDESQYTGVWGYYSYIFEKEQDQEDAPARCLGSNIKEVTEYYAAGTSKDTPPNMADFVTEEDWKEDDSKKVSVTKDFPYLWNYEEIEYESGGTSSTSPQLIGHYGWTTVGETEEQIDDFDVEYDEFGNSLVPYEHTAKSEPKEYYAISSSAYEVPPEKDEDGNDIWRTSVPKATKKEPYLWNKAITHRSAKKEMIVFSDVISTGEYNYKKILTVDLSDEFEAPPKKEQLNAFLRGYITEYHLAEKNFSITLDYSQLDENAAKVSLGDTLTVYFNDEQREVRCTKVVWDVVKERYSSVEVGKSSYSGLGDAFSKYAISNDSTGKYSMGGMLAYMDNGYIKADTVEARVVKAQEGIFDQVRANYASFNYLEANYIDADTIRSNYIDAETIRANYLTADSATIRDLEAETAKIQSLSAAELTATVGYINELTANNITTENIEALSAAMGILAANYAELDYATIDEAVIKSGWANELMIQSQFIAQQGTIYKLQLLELDANKITAGVMTADHLQLRGNDGLYYQLNYDALGESKWEQLTPEEQNKLKAHIHADTILANSITTKHITADNLVGTGGWINLAKGTFEYKNTTSGNGITWDGTKLTINADSLSIGSRSVEEVIQDSTGINRMPSVYLSEVFYGKIFNDEDNGIIWTVNPDGSVTATGTATNESRYYFTSCNLDDETPVITIDPEKKYTVSGCPDGNGNDPNYWIGGRLYPSSETPTGSGGTIFAETGNAYTTSTAGWKYISLYAQIKKGYTIPAGGITFYPMLESGETAHNYVSTHDGSGGLVEKIGIAEAKIEVNSDNIEAKVSKDGLISEINLRAGEASIRSQAIDLEGAVTFSSFGASAKAAMVKNVTTKNQWYLSNSATGQSGGSWVDNLSSIDFSGDLSNKYLYSRVQVTRTYADDTTGVSYSAAVRDDSFRTNYQNSKQAVATANSSIASQESIYFRTVTSTWNSSNNPTSSTAIGVAENQNNVWSYIMPQPGKDPSTKAAYHYWTCERYTYKDGSVGFSTVRKMSNLDYTAMWCSANDRTCIDGAAIYTGSITADQIAANAITAKHIKAGEITADMITAGAMSADRIKGGKIDCNGQFTFQLTDTIVTPGAKYDIFKLSGLDADNARVDINTADFYYNGTNIQNGLINLTNFDKEANGPTVSGITNNSGRYCRFGNVIVVSFTFKASAALSSAIAVLNGLPAALYTGATYAPRTTFNSDAGNIGWGFVNDSGELRVRVTSAGTYFGGITYITRNVNKVRS